MDNRNRKAAAPGPNSTSKNLVWKGFAWAMTANISFVAIMVLNRLFRMHLPIILVIWGRSMFALAVMLPFVQWRGIRALWGIQLARGLLIAGALICSYTAYRHLPVHFAALIGASSSLFSMLLAALFLKEKIDTKRWVAVMLGYAGVAILLHGGLKQGGDTYVVCAILGNILAAMAAVLSRWLVLQSVHPQSSIVYGMIIPCVLFSLIIAVDPTLSLVDLEWAQWKKLALLGGIGALIQYATFSAYTVVKASFVAPLEYTRLCLMIPAGYFFFGELPTKWSYIGGALIVMISLCFVVWEARKN